MYNALQTIQAFEAGQGQRKAREQEAAMKGVGNALAGGNYAGASSSLFSMGNIEGGLKVAEYGKSLQDAEAERKRVGAIRYGMGLLSTPPEQREAMRGQIGQTLGGMGWQLDENAIATMDLSDEGIKATLATLQDTDGLMKQYQSMMAPAEYGLELVPVQGADGKIQYVQASKAGGVRPVEGYQPVPETPDLPEGMRLTADGQYEWIPGYLEAQEKLRRAGASSTNITLPGEKGENKFQEGLGSQAATNFQTIVDQGRAASASIGNLDTMETLLDSIDYTGFGGDTLLQVQRAGAMLGFEIPDLPAKEAAKRLSSQMALSLKTDLPGPMSNADREFLLSIPPNLNSTQAGNDAILFILRKREERKQDMMQSLLQADPRSMEEYRAWENQYLQSTPPMFTPATQASLLKALGGAAQ